LRRLDRQIRDNALSRLHEAPADWFLSLNMSPRWISRLRADQALPSLKQLPRYGIDPQRIVFEITELGGNSQRLAEVVARYREAGARIAIDDFGAGYSQLDRVLALQPDILKLDMRLFQAAALGGPSSDVVKALAQMAEKTGCWIIAEGVETEAQLNFALECGSRYVQGFLFARAQEAFFATDAFVQRFAELRQRYVRQKLAERGRLMQMRQQLAELMSILQAWAQAHAPLSALPQLDAFPGCCAFINATATAHN
jgi:EAL domain-containing protein (putative c-di-GMP-specific phosphodiesterase class I)